jgi:predicted DNA-binding antitoxin AbrB/MazE fold protein
MNSANAMFTEIEAIYENGVLRPLEPLALTENEHVKVTVARATDEDWLDADFMNACAADADPSITLEQVRGSLSKIRGSMDEAIQTDRGEF